MKSEGKVGTAASGGTNVNGTVPKHYVGPQSSAIYPNSHPTLRDMLEDTRSVLNEGHHDIEPRSL